MPEARLLDASAGGAAPDWIAIGPPAALDRLTPLVRAHAAMGRRVLQMPAAHGAAIRRAIAQASAALAADGAGLLVVEPLEEPPIRAGWPCPLLPAGRAPTGYLRLGPPALAAYAERAAALLQRPAGGATPFPLLGPREPRYLDQLEALAQGLRAPTEAGLLPLMWTAERLRKPELLLALRQGAACALYAGHGNRHGWLAYGGLGIDDLQQEMPWKPTESTGLLVSLACASGAPGGFADAAIAHGLAGAVLAPMNDPMNSDNRRLAEALGRALGEGQPCIGALARIAAAQPLPMTGYVLLGDPGLPPHAAVDGLERCAEVVALPPNALVEAAGT